MIFMVDLDSIRDTRLVTLASLVPHDKIKIEDWIARFDDVAHLGSLGLTYEQFSEAHSNRTIEWLRDKFTMPTLTPMVKYINALRESIPERQLDENRLYINTWPYKFNVEETSIVLTSCRELFRPFGIVELVHASPAETTPTFIESKRIDKIITYNGFDLFNLHADRFFEYPMQKLEIVMPKILHHDRDRDNELVVPPGEDPFDLIQVTYSMAITFVFEPVDLWCLDYR